MLILVVSWIVITLYSTLGASSSLSPPSSSCSCTIDGDISSPDNENPLPYLINHLDGTHRYKINCVGHSTVSSISNLCLPKKGVESLHLVGANMTSGSFSRVVNRLEVTRLKLSDSIVESSNNTNLSMENIRILDLSFNRIHSLGGFQTLFKSVAFKLDLLDLSGNGLSSVDGYLDDFVNLTRFYLRHNKIVSINETTFRNLINLRHLYLDSNNIVRVHKNSFQTLRKLNYLVLTSNPLHHFSDVLFPRFLSFIDLSECLLSHLPLQLLSSVRYLQLKKNRIKYLDETTSAKSDLIILVLDNNFVAGSSDYFFSKLHTLRQVWLNNNNLINLPSNLPVQLQKLFLDGNSISSLFGSSFPNRSELRTLSLAGNQIQSLEENVFSRLNKLEYLDLSSNKIAVISKSSLNGLESLGTLHLSNNPIQVLDSGVFDKVNSLKALTISNVAQNPKLYQVNLFENLLNLEVLDLEGSPSLISNLLRSSMFSSERKLLQVLNIANSELTSFTTSDLLKFKNIESLKISSNSWVCNSLIIHFKFWLMAQQSRFASINKSINKCSAPSKLKDKLIISLKNSELADNDEDSTNFLKNETSFEFLNHTQLSFGKVSWLETDIKKIPKRVTTEGGSTDIINTNDPCESSEDLSMKDHDLNSTNNSEITSNEVKNILAALISSTIILSILVAFVLGLQMLLNKRPPKYARENSFHDTALLSVSLTKNQHYSTASNWESTCHSPSSISWKKYKWDEL